MKSVLLSAMFLGVTLGLGLGSVALAGGPGSNDFNENNNWPAPQFQAKVETRPDGVYIQITARQSIPGSSPAGAPRVTLTPSSDPAPRPASSPTSSSVTSPASNGSSADRTWTDATGIYEQTPEGQIYYLTIPDLSSAIDWRSLLAQYPNQTPYTLYVDNQFQGIVWIPNGKGPVRLGAPPAQVSVPSPPPAGNGSSTNPYQVALSLLDRVPLPPIQIEMNPGLGLVNLPGWFWVKGYDGKPFGTSQTVTIPPAVGADVPFTQVPADDPRRQPTSFTVSVKVWPTSYQWSFGDGASLDTQSLGQAYPAQSDIQHIYAFSSLKTPNGFPIQLTVIFAAQYQVNGGAPQSLPSITHTYTTSYPVQEAQSLLTSR